MALADLDLDRQRIVVHTEWSEKDLIKQVPGMRWDSREKIWHGSVSWGTCVVLRGVFQEKLTIGPLLTQWAVQHRVHVDRALKLRDDLVLSGYEQSSEAQVIRSWDTGLYPFQEVGALFLATSTDALDGSQMGVGKTIVVLSALRCLLETEQQPLPALVICPKSVMGQWEREAERWCSSVTPYVVTGGAAKRRKLLEEAADNPTALVILNFEAVRLHSRLAPYGSVRLTRCPDCGGADERVTPSRCHVHEKELNALGFHTVVVDEVHRMKDPKSQQTRACWAVQHGPTVTRRWALTGTPIANDVGDLWSVMHGIAPLDYPTRSSYLDRYALLAWNRYAALDIVGVRPDTREEFERVLYPKFRRMLKEQVLSHLPPKVREVREAHMSPKQAKAYREMEAELLTDLEGEGYVLAPTNLTKALRLLQFSSSYVEVQEDGSIRLCEPSPKLDVLEEVLDELGSDRQIAVCAASRQLIELAAVRLDRRGDTYRLLTGRVPHHERQPNLEAFQRGDAQVMLFTIAAGGVGVNMTAADTIAFLQRSWSMLENSQAEDRVHRVGSERHESVTVLDIVAPDTIEVHQLAKLNEKAERLEEIVRDRERLRAAGYDTAALDQEELQLLAGQLWSPEVD